MKNSLDTSTPNKEPMKNKDKTAKAAKESEASKKARAARDKARREAAKASKAQPAKKAPKKAAKPVKAAKPAKKAASAKKAAKVGKPAVKVPTNTRLPKSAATSTPKPAPKVVTGHKAGTLPDDVTKNGVLQPREGTQARKLWGVCDSLQKTLGRPPARFEFRKAIQDFKGMDGKTNINPDSASFQYFAWRKFHGVKGRSIGIYPKRNTFEANTPAPVKVPAKKAAKVPAKKAAKKAAPAVKKAPAKKTTAADVKRHERLATAAIGKPPAKSAPAPVSERAAKASNAAKVLVVTPPAPAAV